MRSSMYASLVLGVIALTPRSAGAAEPPHARVRLLFESSEHCPTRSEFQQEVAARLGYDPFDGEATAAAAVSLAKDEHRASARVYVVVPEEEHEGPSEPPRVLDKRFNSDKGDCAEVMRSSAASVAIFLDPIFRAPRPPLTRQPPVGVSSERAEPLPSPRATPLPKFVPVVQGELIGSLGLAPSFGLGGAVHLGVQYRSILAMVGAQAEGSLSAREFSGADVTASYVAANSEGCFAPEPFVLCASASIGRYHARAEERPGAGASEASAFFPVAGLRAGVMIPVGKQLKLWFTPRLRVPLTELQLLRSGQTTWQTPALSAALALGLSWSP